jgi:hypothetical protein
MLSTSNQSLVLGAGCFALGAAAVWFLKDPGQYKEIKRWGVSPRAAMAVSHGNIVYLSGQVGWIDKPGGEIADTVEEQTRQTLKKIDSLLDQAGTSKHHILSTQIWVKVRYLGHLCPSITRHVTHTLFLTPSAYMSACAVFKYVLFDRILRRILHP